MNPLILSGYGVQLKVNNIKSKSELIIKDGRDGFKEQTTYSFRPRKISYDSIIIDGHSGYISLKAFHWLSQNKIPVYILNYDGNLTSTILPPTPVKADLKVAQIEASKDPKKSFTIACELVKGKIQRSRDVLKWLSERYDIDKQLRKVEAEALKLSKAQTVNQIQSVEGRVALQYWKAIQSVIPETFCFTGRMTKTHQNNATDPVNLCLNYAYGVLEGEVRKAINSIGLEPSIGFLHEFSSSQTKQSLVYDLQEPFRWLCDLTTIEAFESGIVDMKDFYFMGDDYSYKIEVDSKKRFLEFLKNKFNSPVEYKGKKWKWDTIILNKTQECARYFLGKSESIDFNNPSIHLQRVDNLELRKRILELTQEEAKELNISRSTLHNLHKNANEIKSFKVYQKINNKLKVTKG